METLETSSTKECLTPLGWNIQDEDDDADTIRFYGAGTSCVDVSSMGSQRGLLGGSSRPLAIWMSEIIHVKPALWQ